MYPLYLHTTAPLFHVLSHLGSPVGRHPCTMDIMYAAAFPPRRVEIELSSSFPEHDGMPCAAATNVITVGSEGRAEILASLLDKGGRDPSSDEDGDNRASRHKHPGISWQRSRRGFVSYTGSYEGVPVSILMINMGYPNMDFFVRELREITSGPLRIIRLGSCAGLRPNIPVGTLCVATEGSTFIRQNPDHWTRLSATDSNGVDSIKTEGGSVEPYIFHNVALADKDLSRELSRELKDALGEDGVVDCLNASTDSFYSSQGERCIYLHHSPSALLNSFPLCFRVKLEL